MPLAWEKTTVNMTVHPPHRSHPARARLVRGRRRVAHSPAPRPTRAIGSSQEISPASRSLNMRSQPGLPAKLAPAPSPEPPEPKIREKPL